MPVLKFLPNEGDIDQGLGDAGIETFRDSPYVSVARECAQNSSDARTKKPVIVTFDLFEIDAGDLPGIDQYRLAIESCLLKAKASDIEKEKEFFENAKRSLNKDKIKVLRISDKNTKGLVGPSTKGTPFHSLLKGSGVSVKQDATSGGSFGIGKNAAYAISDIQTVFYSTLYEDANTKNIEYLCQAKSVLVSHEDGNDKSNLAVGYWGEIDYKPVTSQSAVPEWLRRTEIGTSVFCIACREVPNWEYGLVASLLQNFFTAIQRDEMRFSVNNLTEEAVGAVEIDKDTIAELFSGPHYRQDAIDNGNEEDFDFSSYLFEALNSLETKNTEIVIPEIGKVSIRILLRDGLPKRVCFIRNGMYITDNLENFGEKFRRFPLYKDFVALVEPVDEKGRELLKKLENPKHNGFSAERLHNPTDRLKASSAMKKLGKKIRDEIKVHSLVKPEDSVSIDELAEFFAGDVDPEKLVDPDSTDLNPEQYKYKPVKRKPQSPPPVTGDSDNGNEGSGSDINDGDGGDGGGNSNGVSRGPKGGRVIQLTETRNIIVNGDKKKRKVFLTAPVTTEALITINAEGLNAADELEIVATENGGIDSGKIHVAFEKGKKSQFIIEFSDEYDGPIEFVAVSAAGGVNNEN